MKTMYTILPGQAWAWLLHQLEIWRTSLIQAVIISIVFLIMATLMSAIYASSRADPPIHVIRLDARHLGILCPGTEVLMRNQITIDSPTFLLVSVSVMDETATYNLNDTQKPFDGRPHPHAGSFRQTLPWIVPDLPPGTYTRLLTFRTTDGREDPVFVASLFTIAEISPACPS